MTLHYQFNFARYNDHLVDVTLQFTAHSDNPVIWLPTWIAGSYLIREFSRHITAICATIDNTNSKKNQRLQKLDKNHWQIHAKQGEKITVTYEVYAYDLSVRGAYIDQTRLYGNFTSLAVAVVGQAGEPILAELICPNAFIQAQLEHYGDEPSLVCALPDKLHQQRERTIYQLFANNYEQLTDSPFEIAVQDGFDFEINVKNGNTISHRFAISGTHTTNLERLHDDVNKICQSYLDWLGDAPFADYLFMTMATGNDYGGLEHLASTSLITPRDDLPTLGELPEPSDHYQRFLGLCSHEYFHAWWVKTVRPEPFLAPSFNEESYTHLLWVFEGFTSYIDDFMLQKSGVISQTSYLKLLAEQINRYLQTHGRKQQSIAESSFDAWIKLYRNDENSANAGISYYNKGALVACCLDLVLLKHAKGKRIFDVIKAFYEKAKLENNKRFGMSDSHLNDMMGEFLPEAIWQDFRQNYIDGTTELPLETLLTEQGITIVKSLEDISWGIKTVTDSLSSNGGLKVQRVIRNSPASQAGISAHDVIVAIDGIKASDKVLKTTAKQQAITGDDVPVHVFRRDELLLLNVPVQADSHEKMPEKWVLQANNNLDFLNF